MHGLKKVSLLLDKKKEVHFGSQSCRFVLLNLFTSRTVNVNDRGQTCSDEIHQLVLWNPLEAF